MRREMRRNLLIDLNEFKEAEKYWMTKFSGEISDVKLLRDFLVPDTESYKTKSFKILLGKNSHLTEKLLEISKNNHLSLYIILLSAFKLLISRYTGQRDIIVASPIYSPANEKYNKNVALRDFIDFGLTFKEQVIRVRETVVGGYKNEHYSIDYLSDWLDAEVPVSLFRFVLLLESIHKKELIMDRIFHPGNDLTLCAGLANRQNNREQLELEILYNCSLFKKTTLELMVDTYSYILEQAVDDINIRICHMEFMREEEKKRVLDQFNNTVDNGEGFILGKALHRLFECQVKKTPGNTAVRSSMEILDIYDEFKPEQIDLQVTYEELNARAHQLAQELWHKGIGPNQIAAIMVEHPLEMVAGIWGILKAGAAYLPLDPNYPVNAATRILCDSNAGVLVTEESLAETAAELASSSPLSIIYMDEVGELEAEVTAPELASIDNPSNLAYVIYTSGSTGTPKGVLVEHKGVVNYTRWRIETLGLTAADVTLQPLSYCFDGFASNFFSSLLSGGTLYMIPGSKRLEPTYIKEVISEYKITNVSLVPGIYNYLMESAEPEDLKSLRFVVLAGDRSTVNLIKKSKQKASHVRLLNEYGPTEATVTAAGRPGIDETNPAIIGHPIYNVQIYILDNFLKPLPVNAPGELYIAGAGVARGYLNNPELTKEMFMENPYKTGNRFYKTGDIGRWLPEGEIEFVGRTDRQVKIRGYRIELGEIERQLILNKEIKEAVVIAGENPFGDKAQDKYICAYLVSNQEEKLDISKLKLFLSKRLPDYMIPSNIIQIDKIPLNPNGKIDRKALPEPGITAGDNYTVPSSELEKKLAHMWSEVLRVKKEMIGVDTNFFQLGGHSLIAVTLVSQIYREFNVNVPLAQIFEMPFIRGLAQYISKAKRSIYEKIEPVEKKEYYVLSSVQKRLYILQQMEPTGIAYNIPHIFELKQETDLEELTGIFQKLIQRHETFRTSFFEIIEGKPFQKIHEQVEFSVEYDEAGEHEIDKTMRRFIRPFDMSKAPLMKVGAIKVGEDRYILMVDVHHIIADGKSLEVLVQDFKTLSERGYLLELRLQYKDFSEWQANLKENGAMEQQEKYWLKVFEGGAPTPMMPIDYSRPAKQSFEGSVVSFTLDKQEAKALKIMALEEGVTMYMLFLAIFNVWLSKICRQQDIVVGASVAGRRHADMEKIIGMFVNTLALRNYPQGEKRFKDFLEEVKERTLEAFENQDYPFEYLVNKVETPRDISRNPLFDVMFLFTEFNREAREKSEELSHSSTIKPLNDVNPGKQMTIKFENNVSRFDMTLNVVIIEEDFFFDLIYCTKLFKKETIEKTVSSFKKLVSCVLENPENKLSEIKLISEAERDEILVDSLVDLEDEYA
jgi:amino acid adenylation domain-containing protein